MIVSRAWLQKYFDDPLPKADRIADAFTFHAFEIDAIEKKGEDDILDVKVLPNRAADCLSHRGIARELGAILGLAPKPDVLRAAPPAFPKFEFPKMDSISISIEDARACPRYMAALMRGVKVGPSPAWLKEALESVGQRSINNVVDATNYVMLDLGQPLHAFDAKKLDADGPELPFSIAVRGAKEGERIVTLSGDAIELPANTLLVVDGNDDTPIGIAGIKGGKAAEITDATTDIILESANFDAAMVRRASQKLKLFTDASKRFQNDLSPELAAYALSEAIALIKGVAGGELVGVAEKYPAPQETTQVSVSVARVNALLGTEYSARQVEDVFRRLGFAYKKGGDTFTVDPPFERRDISIPEDLIEEVGRIIGYDAVPAAELPAPSAPADQARFRGIERMKDQLVAEGFIEVSTQSFAKKGDQRLANPLDDSRPYLRTSLEQGLADALAQAKQYAPRVLKPGQKPKLFEVGTVFPKVGEFVELRMTERVPAWGDAAGTTDNLTVAKLEDYGAEYVPLQPALGAFKPFSNYPFILRDIALWTPAGTESKEVEEIIGREAGPLLVRIDQFDRFEKDGRVSYAFRLVFESMERTLSDEDANPLMEKVSAALSERGFEVR
jgi:phenylalanyl-tRNA synthetase beta chain